MRAVILALIAWASFSTGLAVTLLIARQRVYRYAVRVAERCPVASPSHAAYSDMATVIVLSGRCDDRFGPDGPQQVTRSGLDRRPS